MLCFGLLDAIFLKFALSTSVAVTQPHADHLARLKIHRN
jgi:predicted XRE-type DNA-binding protein